MGLSDDEDDFDFEERFLKLKAEFLEQLQEEEHDAGAGKVDDRTGC
ncbi:MAG: hypothetical protein J7L03_02560 [Caldisericaceae bacterium]|nr:hypothetical protein [Caldisericaceae bacterium]